MTTKEAHALTTTAEGLEKLRILAAEADGWKEIKRCSRNLNINEKGICLRGTRDSGSERTYEFIPLYSEDANALHAAEQRLGLHDRANVALRVKWVGALHDLMALQPDCPVNNVGSPVVPDIDKLLAPITIRCAAFVLAAEWKQKIESK